MSLNDKIAQELNHFLKIINYKDSAQPDESLNDEDKKKSIINEGKCFWRSICTGPL